MNPPESCDCKVGRVIEKIGLHDMNAELSARRTGDRDRPASLRDLTEFFNRAVIRSALERAGQNPLEGEVENTYHLLTDDEVKRGTRIQLRNRLKREGVDIEAVEGGFVSHPTMGRHLSDCLGIEHASASGDRLERATRRIFKMQNRAEAVTDNTLSGLASANLIDAGNLTVTVDTQVMCETCGIHTEVGRFIDRGGCDCE